MTLKFNADINTGAAAILYTVGFFGIMLISKWVPAVAQNIVGIEGAWTLGLGGYLLKRYKDNGLDLEAAKAKVGPQLSEIKLQAAGLASGPCPPGGSTP